MRKSIFPLLFASTLFFACENTSTTTETITNKTETVVKDKVPAPEFSGDSAYKFIENQVKFGYRVPNTQAHMMCGDYLIEELKRLGGTVTVQDVQQTAFDGSLLKGRNLFASFFSENSRKVLLAAHYDTRPFADQDDERQKEPILGANDGGSGVAVILEMLRSMQESGKAPRVGVDVILFDLEDYGKPENFESNMAETYCLGSQYWGKNPHAPNYGAYFGILFDMVGAKNAKFGKEGFSMRSAPAIVEKVWNAAHTLGYGEQFLLKETGYITDDHVYVNQYRGIPMVDIIEYDENSAGYFGAYWHTHDDNMDVISRETLKAVGQTSLQVLYNE